MRAPLLACALSALFLAAACGSDDSPTDAPPTQSLQYELHPWTKELTPDTLAAVRDVGPVDGVVRFRGTPAQLADLKRGDVLLAGQSEATPKGILRLVMEVRNEAEGMAVVTRPVPVQLAFRSLHARARTARMAMNKSGQLQPQARISDSKDFSDKTVLDWRVYDQDGDRTTKDDQLYVTGEIGGGIVLAPYIDLDWLNEPAAAAEQLACALTLGISCDGPLRLPDVTVGVDVNVNAKAQIDAEGAASQPFRSDPFPISDTEIDLPDIVVPPFLVISPTLDFVAQVSGSATSRFHAHGGIQYDIDAGASVGVTSGPQFKEPTFTRTFDPPTVEASLTSNVKVAIGPRLALRFWDTFGPTVTVRGFADVHADTKKDPCLGVDLGAELTAGLTLRIPWQQFGAESVGAFFNADGDLWNVELDPKTLFVDEDVMTGACSPLPASVFPPGDGPSEAVYNAPTFTPWSKRFTDAGTALYQTPYSGYLAEHVLHTEQSIDGSWLVTGDGVYGAMKVGESGKLAWAKNLTLAPMQDDELEENGPATYVAQALNTDLWFAASRFTMGKLDQDGDVVWAKRFDPLGADGQVDAEAARVHGPGLSPSSVVPIADGGALVTYQVRDSQVEGPALFVRLREDGTVVWSRAVRLDGAVRSYVPVVVPAGDDFVFAGFSHAGLDRTAHVGRLGPDGTLQWSKRLGVCGSRDVQPTSGILTSAGALAITGPYGAHRESSFLATIPLTGALVNGTAFGPADGSDFLSNAALAELPISGMVTLARDGLHSGSTLRLARHDGQGNLDAGQTFQVAAGALKRGIFPGALRLTTDGGLLLFAHADEADLGRDGVWISKLYAKDLGADFTGTPVTLTPSTALPQQTQAECAFTLTDAPVTLVDFPLASRDVTSFVKTTNVPSPEDTYLPR